MKETKICKHCKEEIDKKAKICPHCRKKQSNSIVKGICIFLVAIFIIGSISSALNDDSNSDSKKSSTTIKEENNKCYATMDKFSNVSTGMTYDEVKEIMGCDGKLSTESSYADQSMKMYYWYAKNGISNVTITFTNDIVSAKGQIGLD